MSAAKTLIDKIRALPPDKRSRVEHYVDLLATPENAPQPSDATARFPRAVLDRIDDRRERLRRDHGLFDSVPIIRELREHGD